MKKNMKRLLCLVLIFAFLLPSSVLATDAQAPSQAENEYADLNEKFADIVELYLTYHIDQVTPEELLNNLMADIIAERPELFNEVVDGMINQTDGYNNLFTADEYQLAFYPPDYVGIGIKVNEEGSYMRIIEVFSHSPAKEAGLQVGDLIVAVDGEDVAGYGTERTGILIRGERDTTVTLTLERGNERLSIEVERREIRTESVQYERIDDIGYISVWDFQDIRVYMQFYSILRDESADGVKGFIVDLRNNTGGDVDAALNMANSFIQEDGRLLATFYNYDGDVEEVRSVDAQLDIDNVVVLVNGYSYSSSEVMAGIMQDLELATIVGTKTGGKGRGQNHIELKDGSVVTITTSEIELPLNGKYHGVGITPDVVVQNTVQRNHVPDLFAMGYEGSLTVGDENADVFGLEQRLWFLGYLKGSGDAVYDQRTASAVKEFQAQKGLAQTGIADGATRQAVDQVILDYMNGETIVDKQLEKAFEIVRGAIKD